MTRHAFFPLWRAIPALLAGAFILSAILSATPARSEVVFWGLSAEQFEFRANGEDDALAWDFDVIHGGDDVRAVWRSKAEYGLRAHAFEKLENQLRLQTPVSDFFDAVAGIRLDTPVGPDRAHAVVGLHGLAKQWFEIDADLYLSDHPSVRFEIDYEGLITNRLILVPSIELDVPLTDDRAVESGALGPTMEAGARLSYDLIDRLVSPYVGLHYERSFGRTADFIRAGGGDAGALFVVAGMRVLF